MPNVRLGAKNEPGLNLEQSNDLIAIRTHSRESVLSRGPVASPLEAQVSDGERVARFPEAGVEVYRVPTARRSLEDRKAALRADPDVRFAGGVLVDPGSGRPVLYTENLFVKFADSEDPEDCVRVLSAFGLEVKQKLDYAVNAYFVAPPEGSGQKVFDIAEQLLAREDVEYCHPELIRPREGKLIFPQQWHLKPAVIGGATVNAHANVEAAHEITRGAGVTIAIIDDGVDIDHPEFASPGKVVAPRDASLGTSDPRPKDPGFAENHGTACAGVACGDGALGASGVAPQAKLMPIRLSSGLGSVQEAAAFKWASDNGADVISCSWGPEDGEWFNPADPLHNQVTPMPASTKLAIDFVTQNGRGGKGCVVLFAAGNGRESVDNDGYASYEKVIAVAACNDRGTRSVYSDSGKAVWCAFPSSDFAFPDFQNPKPLTTGIWTTDRRSSRGYNPGNPAKGDADGLFTNSFGGTSSSCPGAAGVAALVLSTNPDLKWHEVREILKLSSDKIDLANGQYDATGRSLLYGHGRLNARRAVELAKPLPRNSVTVTRNFDAPLPDLQTREFALAITETAVVASITVNLNIRHTFIGDLRVTLAPPASAGVGEIVLHSRTGGSTKNLKQTYDAVSAPKLAGLSGKKCNGVWTLRIADQEAGDDGALISFGVTLNFSPVGSRALTDAREAMLKLSSSSAGAPQKRSSKKASARAPRRK